MTVTVVDIGEMLMLVGQCKVTMFRSRQHLDGVAPVVWIVGIDRVRMPNGLMNVAVPVMRRADDDHADK